MLFLFLAVSISSTLFLFPKDLQSG
jgi:hypothetical protein